MNVKKYLAGNERESVKTRVLVVLGLATVGLYGVNDHNRKVMQNADQQIRAGLVSQIDRFGISYTQQDISKLTNEQLEGVISSYIFH